MPKKLLSKDTIPHVTLAILAFLTFFPFIFMIVTSLKDNSQFYHNFWAFLPFRALISNMISVDMERVLIENPLFPWMGIWGSIVNRFIVIISSMVMAMGAASFIAHLFSRNQFPNRGPFVHGIFSLMTIPVVLVLVSPYLEPVQLERVVTENYVFAWEGIRGYILNSFIVTVSSVVGVMAVASLSAYAFARHKFPGSGFLFYAVISLMMIPGVLTLVSSYMWFRQFPFVGGNNWYGAEGHGFLNTYSVLIIPYVAGGQVFAIFILRTFFGNLPEELFEAARIDGGGELQQFLHIAVPLSKPILGTIAIMNIMGSWNDFIWPSIVLTSQRMMTIPVGLRVFQGQYSDDYGSLMAGYTLAAIPLLLLFLFTMRQFVEGLTSGAFKA